jgi:putative serine protease PepD
MGMTENNPGTPEGQPDQPAAHEPSQHSAAAPGEQPNPWAAQQQDPIGHPHSGYQQQGAGQPAPGQPDALQGASGQPGFFQPGTPQAGAPQPGTPQPDVPPGGQQTQQFGAVPGFQQQTHPYYALPGLQPTQRKGGRGKLVAGVAALVLLVGGVAGGVGGYVGQELGRSSQPVSNALDAPKPAQQTASAPAGSVEQVAQKVLPAVVQLQVSSRSGSGEGSGIVISSDGLILTNNHVVEGAAQGGQIKVKFQDGKSADVSVVGRDPSSDLAVVKAQNVSGLPTAELGNSSDLRIGQSVVAIGSPFDLSGTVTSGIVSSLNRPVRAGGDQGSQATVLNAIQTDAAINPGNSGGPLVNMQGQVVGINSAIYSPNSSQSSQGGSVGIGFAIPIDQARRTAKELTDTGKSTQTILGVQVTDAQSGGALVRDVTAGGPAEKAGVKARDVITKFDDRTIDTSDALVAAVRSKAPNDKVKLTIGDRTVEVTLAGQQVG